MLTWLFDYIKIDKQFIVTSSKCYNDGIYVGEENPKNKLMLVSYLALFPKKEIASIKLGTMQNSLYTLLYFDKRYKNKNFIGVFSFSEYNTNEPFIWGKEDQIMEEVFGKFHEVFPNLFLKNENYENEKMNNYFQWLNRRIEESFLEREIAKIEYYQGRNKILQNNLADTFSSIGLKETKIELKQLKRNNNIEEKIGTLGIDMVNRTIAIDNSFQEVDKIISNELKSFQNDLQDEPINVIPISQEKEKDISRYWEIQLINSFGQPLTEIIKINDGKFLESNDEDFTNQGLEAMSYSVLKTLVEMKHLNLKHIKASLPTEKGFEYIFFQDINLKNSHLLIIMSVMNYNKILCHYEDKIMGGERNVLEKIDNRISQHADWFNDNTYVSEEIETYVMNIFYEECGKFFKELRK